MPYISERLREGVLMDGLGAVNPGELNFLLTKVIEKYRETFGTDYHTINDILGALEGVKLEFYRRVAVPYEDRKLRQNGDVYAPNLETED